MPARTPKPRATVVIAAAPKNSTGGVTRKVAPLIPLAIPMALSLAHGALNGVAATGTAPEAARPAAVARMQSLGTPNGVPNLAESTLTGTKCGGGTGASPACPAPYPMLEKGHPVDWFFVFKLNASKFPGCGGGAISCPFGGEPQKYKIGQQYVIASSEAEGLKDGVKDCLGTTTNDPVGATFDAVYHSAFHYIVWNDQFKGSPKLPCGANCDKPWGHSKGLLAWNDAGEGMVMQVSTPSWPAAGNASHARVGDGNTLGCVNDDDVQSSQHFFALRLNKDDLLQVIAALGVASVVTDPKNVQISSLGGPQDVEDSVKGLGKLNPDDAVGSALLSSGVRLIVKPGHLNVPPWQMISALLGGVPLRTATWWMTPQIPATIDTTKPGCWNTQLGAPGPVGIATTGHWNGVEYSLKGGGGTNGNHAKIGVSTAAETPYAIFGDMNQQGSLSGDCDSSQNGRGGLFFVLKSPTLVASMTQLIAGDSAGTTVPPPSKEDKDAADQ